MRLTHQPHIRGRFRSQIVQFAHPGSHVAPDTVVAIDVLWEEGVAGMCVGWGCGGGGGGRGELATGRSGDGGVFEEGRGTEGGGTGEGLEGVSRRVAR